MKTLLTSLSVTVLLASGGGIAQADLLVNGNLNTASIGPQTLATPTGWQVTATRASTGTFMDGCSAEAFANAAIPDPGGAYGLFFKAFQGSVTNAITVNFYQDRPATAGLTYFLTGWAGAGAGYSGLMASSPTKSQFSIQFLDPFNAVLDSTVLDLDQLGVANGNPFNYKEYSLMATAPAGTAKVRVGASMIDGLSNPAGGDQAFVVDAFTLQIPEPSAISLAFLGLAGLMAWRRRK